MLNFILNLIYPPRCIFCRAALEPTSQAQVCLECLNDLPFCLAKPRCKRCGKPISGFAQPQLCDHCRRCRKQSYTRIVSAFEYEGKVRDTLIRYKADSLKRYGKEFARFMALQVQADYAAIPFDLVVAVPPSKKRMREKGFDQSGYLAQQLADRLELAYCKQVLFQREARAKQSSLSYDERFRNVHQNIGIKKPETVAGKTVLLVDDICTTRATLEECARALRSADAAHVYAVTAATTCKRAE